MNSFFNFLNPFSFQGSKAYTKALEKCGLINAEECVVILHGLSQVWI